MKELQQPFDPSKREFLKGIGMITAGLALTACMGAEAPSPEQLNTTEQDQSSAQIAIFDTQFTLWQAQTMMWEHLGKDYRLPARLMYDFGVSPVWTFLNGELSQQEEVNFVVRIYEKYPKLGLAYALTSQVRQHAHITRYEMAQEAQQYGCNTHEQVHLIPILEAATITSWKNDRDLDVINVTIPGNSAVDTLQKWRFNEPFLNIGHVVGSSDYWCEENNDGLYEIRMRSANDIDRAGETLNELAIIKNAYPESIVAAAGGNRGEFMVEATQELELPGLFIAEAWDSENDVPFNMMEGAHVYVPGTKSSTEATARFIRFMKQLYSTGRTTEEIAALICPKHLTEKTYMGIDPLTPDKVKRRAYLLTQKNKEQLLQTRRYFDGFASCSGIKSV
ncbi:hypothetical protein HY468_03720 [Candidatus Roizmanbacteria bacterium]|nr:hypothetical protein [Candidatus Roizmanbacteria bacterium]